MPETVAELIKQALDAARIEPQPTLEILELLFRAWDLLPVPKHEASDSYEISKYIVHLYFQSKDFTKALEWQETYLKCDAANPIRNYGESEFMAAKISLELNQEAAAREWFRAANRKSEGRLFQGSGKTFKKYLDKKDVRPTGFKALLALAETESRAGNYSHALSLLYDCININQMDARAYCLKGICHFELDERDHAADAFTRAYMLQAEKPFAGKDPKYLAFLQTRIAPSR